MRARIALAAFAISVASACGGEDPATSDTRSRLCDAETRADVFQVGLEKTSDEGMFTVRLEDVKVDGQFGPPDRGDNDWVLSIRDASGASMDGAQVTLRPWMPDHGHGTTPLLHDGRPTAEGFEFGPFFLQMGGFWEFRVTVTTTSAEDRAELGFCAEG